MGLAQVRMPSAHSWVDDTVCILSTALTLQLVSQLMMLTAKNILRLVWLSITFYLFIFVTLATRANKIGVKTADFSITPFMDISAVSRSYLQGIHILPCAFHTCTLNLKLLGSDLYVSLQLHSQSASSSLPPSSC